MTINGLPLLARWGRPDELDAHATGGRRDEACTASFLESFFHDDSSELAALVSHATSLRPGHSYSVIKESISRVPTIFCFELSLMTQLPGLLDLSSHSPTLIFAGKTRSVPIAKWPLCIRVSKIRHCSVFFGHQRPWQRYFVCYGPSNGDLNSEHSTKILTFVPPAQLT